MDTTKSEGETKSPASSAATQRPAIESINVRGYKSLDGFSLENLGQINMIVGPGGSGKTNLLEALLLFCSNGDASLIKSVLDLRKQRFEEWSRREYIEFVECLWARSQRSGPLQFEGRCRGIDRLVHIDKLSGPAPIAVVATEQRGTAIESKEPLAAYRVESSFGDAAYTGDLLVMPVDLRITPPTTLSIRARYLSPISHVRGLAPLWSEVEGRGAAEEVLALLRNIDADVDDIRVASSEAGRAYLRVKHRSLGMPPIENLGAGFERALSLSVALQEGAQEIVLIDEFETSLHVGALSSVADFMIRAAQRTNLQVFLTTHSLEAVDACLDAYERNRSLFDAAEEQLQVIRLSLEDGRTNATCLGFAEAKGVRESIGFDLRRTR